MGLAGILPLAFMKQGIIRLATISAFTTAAYIVTYFALFMTVEERRILITILSAIKRKIFGWKININSII